MLACDASISRRQVVCRDPRQSGDVWPPSLVFELGPQSYQTGDRECGEGLEKVFEGERLLGYCIGLRVSLAVLEGNHRKSSQIMGLG